MEKTIVTILFLLSVLSLFISDAQITTRQCNNPGTSPFQWYGLTATTPDPSGTTFVSNWTQNAQAGGFNGVQDMDSCRIKPDPSFPTWHNMPSARVEVNPNDDPLSSGGERAEVLTMQDANGTQWNESPGSGTVWYAASYYFPVGWNCTQTPGVGDWCFCLQFHPADIGALIAMGCADRSRTLTGPQQIWFNGNTTFEFSDGGAIVPGKWMDLIFSINWVTGATVWYRRTQPTTSWTQILNIVNVGMLPATSGYFKQGLYRGPTGSIQRTDVLWLGPSARGDSFNDVELAAFGTSNSNPTTGPVSGGDGSTQSSSGNRIAHWGAELL